MLSTIEERLAEAGLEAKGKLNSWLEGGFEHSGLVQGVKLLLARVQSRSQNTNDLRDVMQQAGSPRDLLMRVGSPLHCLCAKFRMDGVSNFFIKMG